MIEKIQLVILYYPILLFSLSFHESSHAWVAHRLGDDTAKDEGRLTMNPLAHMDLLGTFLLPIFVLMSGARLPFAAWAKPVPVNTYRLKNPIQDHMWIAIAGPVSNIILALICAASVWGFYYLLMTDAALQLTAFPVLLKTLGTVYQMLKLAVWTNLALAFFNLIPIHPLDGSAVATALLPPALAEQYEQFRDYGVFILIIMYYVGFLKLISIPVEWLYIHLLPMM